MRYSLPPLLVGQVDRIVDVQGGGTYVYTTITAAALAADPGDRILIKEITWGPLNQTIGYSETHSGGGEDFPIGIESGVTVQPFDSSHTVVVWSNATTPPSSLFNLLGTSAPAPVTKFQDIILFGGVAGIEAKTEATAQDEITAIIARVDFAWNHIAFDAEYKSGTLANFSLRDCRIVDNVMPIPSGFTDAPNYQLQSVGVRLHALEVTDQEAGRIDAELRNLKTIGIFNQIDPSFVPLPENSRQDLVGPEIEFSRVVEVFAEGDGSTLEHSQSNPYAPIPQVNLSIVGGDYQGAAQSANPSYGWDVGLFASAAYPVNYDVDDFTAGYDVDTSGAVFNAFRLAGVHGVSELYTRGVVHLTGNTEVTNTGVQANRIDFEDLYCGVHMYVWEGYIGLDCSDAEISNNAGHGIFLHTDFTVLRGSYLAAAGNYLEMESCDIHENGGSGIKMDSHPGMVGGAWHFTDPPANNLGMKEMSGYTYSVDYGQGSINRCNISNNSEYGLEFDIQGSTNTAASTRFVNTIIWNNARGGYYADLADNSSSPFFLVPLLHSTFAGNGDGVIPAGYSADIHEESRLNGDNGIYEWSGPGGSLHTKFFNTIFQRKQWDDEDFSGELYGFMMDDTQPPYSNQIGVAGIRGYSTGLGLPFGFSIDDNAPFISTTNWTSLDPANYYLQNLGIGDVFGATPFNLPLISTESFKDHRGDIRPPTSTGLRDKGAEEL